MGRTQGLQVCYRTACKKGRRAGKADPPAEAAVQEDQVPARASSMGCRVPGRRGPNTLLGPRLWAVMRGKVCPPWGSAAAGARAQDCLQPAGLSPQGPSSPPSTALPSASFCWRAQPTGKPKYRQRHQCGGPLPGSPPVQPQLHPSLTLLRAGTRTSAQSQPAQRWKHQTCPCLAMAPPG